MTRGATFVVVVVVVVAVAVVVVVVVVVAVVVAVVVVVVVAVVVVPSSCRYGYTDTHYQGGHSPLFLLQGRPTSAR